MNEIQCVKRDLNLKQWSEIIADRQARGKSIKQYCKEHHLRENTYYYWQKILREQAIASVKEEAASPLVKVNLNRDPEYEMTEQIKALTQQMEKMTETINYLTRKLYGRKSEKANVICEGQLTMDSLFNEAEAVNDPKAEEPVVEEVTYTRRKKQKGKRKADLSGLPHQKVIHGLAEEDLICPKFKSIAKKDSNEVFNSIC